MVLSVLEATLSPRRGMTGEPVPFLLECKIRMDKGMAMAMTAMTSTIVNAGEEDRLFNIGANLVRALICP
jgi:hypothetical protein